MFGLTPYMTSKTESGYFVVKAAMPSPFSAKSRPHGCMAARPQGQKKNCNGLRSDQKVLFRLDLLRTIFTRTSNFELGGRLQIFKKYI